MSDRFIIESLDHSFTTSTTGIGWFTRSAVSQLVLPENKHWRTFSIHAWKFSTTASDDQQVQPSHFARPKLAIKIIIPPNKRVVTKSQGVCVCSESLTRNYTHFYAFQHVPSGMATGV